MTLIALLSPPGANPFLMGDALLSSPVQSVPRHRFLLPVSGGLVPISKPLDPRYEVSSLAQKVTLISDNLAIAWSGPRYAAHAVLSDIRDKFSNETSLSDQKILEFLESLQYKEKNEVSLLGIALDVDARRKYAFGWGAIDQSYSRFYGNVDSAGSGIDHFKELIAKADNFAIEGDFPAAWAGHMAFARVVLLAYETLGTEIFGGAKNLSSFYGGFIEVAHVVNWKIGKFLDVTCMFWISEAPEKILT
jgi:hypothetical protein